MKLEIKRLYYTDDSTVGELSIDGKFECHVIEDKVQAPWEAKVYGKTAIPAGSYRVTVEVSPRFSAKAGVTVLKPRLHEVPGFEGVLIHEGNSAADSLGCLLVGQYDPKKPNWVSNSRLTYGHLYTKLTQAQQHGQPMTLSIMDTKAFPEPPKKPKGAK